MLSTPDTAKETLDALTICQKLSHITITQLQFILDHHNPL